METFRKLRLGMVGGGPGAFIGAVHRMAANLDGEYALVAGAFSSQAEKSQQAGRELGLDPRRVYASFAEMATTEAALPPAERIDAVSIVTPNHLHFPVAKAFLEAGIPVICDKPMTHSLDEARALVQVVEQTGTLFVLTHNYTGYPLVKEARELVRRGHLGRILKVVAEYPQDWLLSPLEAEGQKQAAWRTDPAQAGAAGALGDIGTHAENLAQYITGLEIERLCADFGRVVPGRQLEDDANLLIRYQGGARGVLYASQISAGEENNLRIRVYGEKASLEWHQEEPNKLLVKYPDAPTQIRRRGQGYLSAEAQRFGRIPPGHPEAFIEAFANVYREAARAIRDRQAGREAEDYDFPTAQDGLNGLRFLAAAVASAANDAQWTALP